MAMITAEQRPVCGLMVKIAQLAIALGAAPLNAHAGVWHHALSEKCEVFVNGHRTPERYEQGGTSFEITPFAAHVFYNGWPNIVDPYGYAGGVSPGVLEAEVDRAIADAQQWRREK